MSFMKSLNKIFVDPGGPSNLNENSCKSHRSSSVICVGMQEKATSDEYFPPGVEKGELLQNLAILRKNEESFKNQREFWGFLLKIAMEN